MADAPLLSVGMSVRNNASTLALALRSLLHQTLTDWELILIDDGSTDASVAIAHKFADPRIRLVTESASRGLAYRLNQALDLSRGRYFARMDGDDVCFPERFSLQTAYLNRHPEVDLLGSGGVVFSSNGRALGMRPTPTTHEEICHRPWSGFYLAHPSWMGRLDWFRHYRYDERALKAQDYDLLLRTYRTSLFAALPEPLIGYREERLYISKSIASRRQTVAAQWRHAYETGNWWRLPIAIMEQIAKGGLELAVIGTRIERRLLSHRILPIDTDIEQRWVNLWRELQQDDSDRCVD